MPIEVQELDQLQGSYKEAVDEWIAAIRHEESLASVDHSVADVDSWEVAGDEENEARKKAEAAKTAYESALRQKFFNF